jgi:hypothetical protein
LAIIEIINQIIFYFFRSATAKTPGSPWTPKADPSLDIMMRSLGTIELSVSGGFDTHPLPTGPIARYYSYIKA